MLTYDIHSWWFLWFPMVSMVKRCDGASTYPSTLMRMSPIEQSVACRHNVQTCSSSNRPAVHSANKIQFRGARYCGRLWRMCGESGLSSGFSTMPMSYLYSSYLHDYFWRQFQLKRIYVSLLFPLDHMNWSS